MKFWHEVIKLPCLADATFHGQITTVRNAQWLRSDSTAEEYWEQGSESSKRRYVGNWISIV